MSGQAQAQGQDKVTPDSGNILDSFNVEKIDEIDFDALDDEGAAAALKAARAGDGGGDPDAGDPDGAGKGAGENPDEEEPDPMVALQEQNAQLVEIVKRLATGRAAPPQREDPANTKGISFFPGKEDDDIPTVQELNQTFGQLIGAIQNIMQTAVMPMTKTNYAETVQTFLPKAFESEPELAEAIKAGNQGLINYHVARLVQKLSDGEGGGKPKPNKGGKTGEDAQSLVDRITKNLKKPGAPSAAAPASPLGRMAAIDDMNDADFGKLVEGVIASTKTISRRKR